MQPDLISPPTHHESAPAPQSRLTEPDSLSSGVLRALAPLAILALVAGSPAGAVEIRAIDGSGNNLTNDHAACGTRGR